MAFPSAEAGPKQRRGPHRIEGGTKASAPAGSPEGRCQEIVEKFVLLVEKSLPAGARAAFRRAMDKEVASLREECAAAASGEKSDRCIRQSETLKDLESCVGLGPAP